MLKDCFAAERNRKDLSRMEEELIKRYHLDEVQEHQSSSSLVKHVKAPLPLQVATSDSLHCFKDGFAELRVHPEVIEGRPGALVIESFVVDVPDGNTKEETCYFVEALIKCDLQLLADVSERLALQDITESIHRI